MTPSLPLPKPWQERPAVDPLLAQPLPVREDGDRVTPAVRPMLAMGNALAGAITKLGEREALCETHGAYVSTGTRLGVNTAHDVWSGCKACQAEAEAARAQARRDAEAAARLAQLSDALKQSALPDRFLGRTFGNFVASTPEQAHALDVVRRFSDGIEEASRRGTTLVLAGGVGTGKSHLAGAAIQQIAGHHKQGLYVTVLSLLRLVRDTWRRDSPRTESQVMSELAAVDLLVVDEVGLQYDTDAEKTLLTEVMDRRYLDCKPSILITNLGLEAFKAHVGDRVYSRLKETGTWVQFDWADYRSTARKEGQP